MEFNTFKKAVSKQFAFMQKNGSLFTTEVNKEDLWNIYLNSFPADSNHIYRIRKKYDCSCCRNFIKKIGNVVSIINGKVVSIWDIDILNEEAIFQKIADSLSYYVKSYQINSIF